MAETFPVEGRDFMLAIFPKNGTNAATLYLGLLSGGDGTTVPATTDTLAALDAPFAEVTYSGYTARVALPAADWTGGPATENLSDITNARVLTAAQKSFPAAGAAYSTPITGFFIATTSAFGTGVAIYYSNFTNGAADVIASLALGDIVRVTPKLGLGA